MAKTYPSIRKKRGYCVVKKTERKNQSHRSSINPLLSNPFRCFFLYLSQMTDAILSRKETAQKKNLVSINPHPQAQIPGPKNIRKKKEIVVSTKEKEK